MTNFCKYLRISTFLVARCGVIAGGAFVLGLPAFGNDFTPVATLRSFDRHNSPGLPQSTVSVFAQDNEGVLWLGTYDGLARYDGNEITEVLPRDGQPNFGFVTDLARRRLGGGSVGGAAGISVYDGSNWRSAGINKSVVSIAEDSLGRLWAVDQHGEVWRQDVVPNGAWKNIPAGRALGPASKLSIGPLGTIWVATHTAVASIQDDTAQATAPLPGPESVVTALRADDEHGCWAATRAGVVWHLGEDAQWTAVGKGAVPGGPILALAEDWRHRLWCANSSGAVAFAGQGAAWTVWGPENGFNSVAGVSALFADRERTIWLGENGHGAQQYTSEAWTHRTQWMGDSGIQSGVVIGGISETARGGLLVAVYGLGFWRWEDGHLTQCGTSSGLVATVRCAVEPSPGTTWAGTRGGIFESENNGPFRQTLSLPSGLVNNICRSPGGTWYALTTNNGILARTPGGWLPAEELNRKIPDLNVKSMLWRSNGETWIGTLGGVTVVRGAGATTYSVRDNPAIPTPVQCLLEVGSDEVWVGGTGGIAAWSGGAWHPASKGEPLPGRTIYALAREPGGTIWASGGAGVGRFQAGHWSIFDSHNGLLNDECNLDGLLVSRDGSIYVSTMGGLARYDPSAKEAPPPPLHCYWRDRPAAGPDGISHLQKGARSLSLTWSAPWLAPTPVEYRSRITPLSPSWSAPSPARELKFANLSPGLWTVEVQARVAGSGQAGWTSPIVARIEIAPYFWETTWAPVATAVALALALAAVLNGRNRQLRRRQEELQMAVAEAQASVKTLRGMIPICASCKNIRDDRGAWNRMEAYVQRHSEAEFSHGMCPACARRLFPDVEQPGGDDVQGH